MPDLPPATPPRSRAGATVLVLFLVAALTAITAAVLAWVTAAGTDAAHPAPEACCPDGGPPPAPATRPVPQATTSAAAGPTREPTLPLCIVGSWRVVSETVRVPFYRDVGPVPTRLSSGAKEYEFRPDGTGVLIFDQVSHTGSYQGEALRVEWDGRWEFTWSADENAITYHAVTSSTVDWSYHVNSRQTDSGRLPADPDLGEVDQYRCGGGVLEESNQDTGYQAVWERTDAFGWYG